MNGQGSIEDARRRLEERLGIPPGSLDPTPIVQQDVERVNQAVARGLDSARDVIGSLVTRGQYLNLRTLANSLGALIQAKRYGK